MSKAGRGARHVSTLSFLPAEFRNVDSVTVCLDLTLSEDQQRSLAERCECRPQGGTGETFFQASTKADPGTAIGLIRFGKTDFHLTIEHRHGRRAPYKKVAKSRIEGVFAFLREHARAVTVAKWSETRSMSHDEFVKDNPALAQKTLDVPPQPGTGDISLRVTGIEVELQPSPTGLEAGFRLSWGKPRISLSVWLRGLKLERLDDAFRAPRAEYQRIAEALEATGIPAASAERSSDNAR
jgi:hypothetical protein